MEPQGQATSPCSTSEHRKCGWRVLEQGPHISHHNTTAVWASRYSSRGNRMCHSPGDDSTHPQASPQCSLGWPGTPCAQGLTNSPPWPGPEPGCQLPAGLASNPINVTKSLLPALSPALARAVTPSGGWRPAEAEPEPTPSCTPGLQPIWVASATASSTHPGTRPFSQTGRLSAGEYVKVGRLCETP